MTVKHVCVMPALWGGPGVQTHSDQTKKWSKINQTKLIEGKCKALRPRKRKLSAQMQNGE